MEADVTTLIRQLAAALATTADAVQKSHKGRGLEKETLVALEDARSIAARIAAEEA